MQNRKTYERKNAYSSEDWVLCKVFKHIVFGSDNLPYDDFFDLDPFYRFVQLNPNSIIGLIESLAYNLLFSEEEVKEIFAGTFYADYDFYHEPYSEYINLVLNKYFDVSDIQVEFEKFDFAGERRHLSDEDIENIKRKKYTRRKYIISQDVENRSFFNEFSRNVQASDYIMGDVLNIVYGGTEESKSNRDDDDDGGRKKSGGRRKSKNRKKSGGRRKSGGRKKSGGRRKSGGRKKSGSKRKSKNRKKSGGRRKKSKK